MLTHKQQFQTIDEYVETFPEDVQRILKRLRQTIQEAAPEATEAISYQMPTFKLNGDFLVSFAAWKNHIGMYPMPSGTEAFERESAPYKGAKSTVRFPIEKPIPYDFVKKIVALRMKENQKKKK